MDERPVFMSEVKYYRSILRLAYETGRHLRELGVLEPDAFCDDGRPLFLISSQALEKAKARINSHRAQIERSRRNLPNLYAQ
jgi:hypothetical protein